jgi:hypothetical protein
MNYFSKLTKCLALLCFLLLGASPAWLQAQGNTAFMRAYGTLANEREVESISTFANGDFVTASHIWNSTGGADVLVTRLNAAGNVVWSRIIGQNNNQNEFHPRVHVDAVSGNVLLTFRAGVNLVVSTLEAASGNTLSQRSSTSTLYVQDIVQLPNTTNLNGDYMLVGGVAAFGAGPDFMPSSYNGGTVVRFNRTTLSPTWTYSISNQAVTNFSNGTFNATDNSVRCVGGVSGGGTGVVILSVASGSLITSIDYDPQTQTCDFGAQAYGIDALALPNGRIAYLTTASGYTGSQPNDFGLIVTSTSTTNNATWYRYGLSNGAQEEMLGMFNLANGNVLAWGRIFRSSGDNNMLFVELDPLTGTVVRAREFGGSGSDLAKAMALNNDETYLLAGGSDSYRFPTETSTNSNLYLVSSNLSSANIGCALTYTLSTTCSSAVPMSNPSAAGTTNDVFANSTIPNAAYTLNTLPICPFCAGAGSTVQISNTSSTTCTGGTIQINITNATDFANWQFVWRFNGNIIPGQTGSSLTIAGATAANNGTYQVTVTDPVANCATTASTTVNLTPSTLAPITISGDNPSCVGQPINLTVSPTAGATNIVWTKAGQAPVSGANLNFNPSLPAHFGTWTVSVSDGSCTLTRTVSIDSSSCPPPCNFTAGVIENGSNEYCVGNSLFLAILLDAGVSAAWIDPQGNVRSSTSELSIPSLATADFGTWTLIQTLSATCADTVTFDVNIGPCCTQPGPISGLLTEYCINNTLALSVVNDINFTYEWQDPQGTPISTTAELNIASLSSTDFGNWALVRTNIASGCSFTNNFTITQGTCIELCNDGIDNDGDGLVDCQDPDCSFSAFIVENIYGTYCPGNYLIASVIIDPNYTIQWKNPQGIVVATGFDLIINSLAASDFGSWTMIQTSLDGCTANRTFNVTLGTCPEICGDGIDNDGDGLTDCQDPDCSVGIATVDNIPANLCIGNPINLFLNTNGEFMSSIIWTGPISQQVFDLYFLDIASMASTDFGLWTVNYTNMNGCSASSTFNLSQGNCCTPSPVNIFPSYSGNIVCSGQDVYLTADYQGPGLTYVWTGPGITNPSANPQLISNIATTQAGIYTVVVTDANGCTSSGNLDVLVAPSLSFTTVVSSDLCNTNSGAVAVTVAGGTPVYSYILDGTAYQNNTGISSPTFNISNLAPGAYTLLVSDINKCNASLPVVVNTSCNCQPVNISLCGPLTDCEGSSLTITPNYLPQVPNGASYAWSTTAAAPIGNSTTAATLTLSNLTTNHAGTYTVVISYENGCTASASVPVIVNPRPALPIVTSTSPVFTGCDITMNANPGYAFYRWSRSNLVLGYGDEVTFSTTNAQIFSSNSAAIVLTVSDNNGCTASRSTTVSRIPDPFISVRGTACANLAAITQKVRFSVTPSSGFTYAWSGPNGPISTSASSITFSGNSLSAVGLYSVTVTSIADPTCFRVATYNFQPCGTFNRESNEENIAEGFDEEELAAHFNVSAYPNPTNGIVNFSVDKIENNKAQVMVKLIDVKGQVHEIRELNAVDGAQGTFDLSKFPAGLYFILFENGEESYLQEIVRE